MYIEKIEITNPQCIPHVLATVSVRTCDTNRPTTQFNTEYKTITDLLRLLDNKRNII